MGFLAPDKPKAAAPPPPPPGTDVDPDKGREREEAARAAQIARASGGRRAQTFGGALIARETQEGRAKRKLGV